MVGEIYKGQYLVSVNSIAQVISSYTAFIRGFLELHTLRVQIVLEKALCNLILGSQWRNLLLLKSCLSWTNGFDD